MPRSWTTAFLLAGIFVFTDHVYGLPTEGQAGLVDTSTQGGLVPDVAGQSTESQQPPTILSPGPHPDVDTSDHGHLTPGPGARLFFSPRLRPTPPHAQQSDSQSTSAAVVSVPELQDHVVNMLHTDYINALTCTNNVATVKFNNETAFHVAVSSWTSAGPFIMITYHDGCGDSQSNGQHGYVLVNSVATSNPRTLTVTLDISHIDFAQAVSPDVNITVNIGGYSPSGDTSFNATAPGMATGISSNTTKPQCGTFDQCLDDDLGASISLDNRMDWNQILPNMTARHVKRSFWGSLTSTIKGVATKIGDTVAKVTGWVGNAVNKVEDTAMQALGTLDKFASINKNINEDVDFNQYPTNAATKWGDAYAIYRGDNIQAYCVGCGINGHLTITGSIVLSVADGIKEGNIAADGNLHGALKLGLDASSLSIEIPIPTQNLVTFSLSDLVIPGILKIGPTVKLGAGGSLGLGASGQMIIGATLDWPAIHAKLDVMSAEQGKADGFVPDFSPVFSAEGTVSAQVQAFLRASMGLEIGILGIEKFSRSVELIDEPGVNIVPEVTGSANTAGAQGEACISLNVFNRVFADVLGIKEFSLLDWNSPAVKRCIDFGTNPNLQIRAPPKHRPPMHIGRKEQLSQPVHKFASPNSAAKRPFTNSTWSSSNATVHSFPLHPDAKNKATDKNATLSAITSLDGKFEIHWAENGNLYAIASNDTTDSLPASSDNDTDISSTDITTQFTTFASTVLGDSTSRILHTYADEISKYGVSRIRLHDPDVLPATSVMVTLRPAKAKNGGADVVVAQDTAGNTYAPLVCVYTKDYPKIFLAPDPVIGAAKLQHLPDLTGPGVKMCGYIPFAVDGSSA